jgi:hypothetical protein
LIQPTVVVYYLRGRNRRRKTRHRGLPRVGWMVTLTAAACNLMRLPKLLMAAA